MEGSVPLTALGSVPLTTLGSAARLAGGGFLFAPGSVDDLAPGLLDDLAPSSADDLAKSLVDNLEKSLVDDVRRKMGFLITFQNIPSRGPYSATLHSKEGVALWTSIGSTGRLAEYGCPLTPELTVSVDEIRRSIAGLASSDKIPVSSSPTTMSICQMANRVEETQSATNQSSTNQHKSPVAPIMNLMIQTRLLATTRILSAESHPAGECHVWVLLEECRV